VLIAILGAVALSVVIVVAVIVGASRSSLVERAMVDLATDDVPVASNSTDANFWPGLRVFEDPLYPGRYLAFSLHGGGSETLRDPGRYIRMFYGDRGRLHALSTAVFTEPRSPVPTRRIRAGLAHVGVVTFNGEDSLTLECRRGDHVPVPMAVEATLSTRRFTRTDVDVLKSAVFLEEHKFIPSGLARDREGTYYYMDRVNYGVIWPPEVRQKEGWLDTVRVFRGQPGHMEQLALTGDSPRGGNVHITDKGKLTMDPYARAAIISAAWSDRQTTTTLERVDQQDVGLQIFRDTGFVTPCTPP
jgi:hypothetical protein